MTVKEVLSLGLADGARRMAMPEDNASETEIQVASEGENLMEEGAGPHKGRANEAQPQVGR